MRNRFKLERVQWPVGHGGFHTGRLGCGRSDLRYFFDCGSRSKEGRAVIREKLAAIRYDFGVISHFDSDHYSELASAKQVKVLFLPYLTPADMVLLALADLAAEKVTLELAFRGFDILRQLRANGTRIVMVDGRGVLQGDVPDGNSEELGGGLSLRIPTRTTVQDTEEMQHEADVEVLQDKTVLLHFKFFNHRVEDASQAFLVELRAAISAGSLIKADKTEYGDVDSFLSDVKAGDALVVRLNGKELQKVYEKTLSSAPLKASPITGSNLSSLAMFSRPATDSPYMGINFSSSALREQSSRYTLPHSDDGWMLTGDLELTPKTWPAFYDHYFYELSRCSVFNVPHHGSAESLCEEAAFFLSGQFFVIPVDANDDKHPAKVLTDRLKRHGEDKQQSVTTDLESTVILETLLDIRC